MNPNQKNKLGRTTLEVTAFSFGAAPVGNFLRRFRKSESDAMFQAAWDAGVRYYDTAPSYGHGLSELRTGQSLRWKNRDDFVLSSKVGRVLKPARRADIDFAPWVDAAPFALHFDYSYDGTMRAFEDSLQRLALERMDICFIHDIDVFTRGAEQPAVFAQAMDGCWRALEKLRNEGSVKAIGVGVNEWQVCHEALKLRDFDCFLLAGRYTLLEQDALEEFLPLCEKGRRRRRRRRIQFRHSRDGREAGRQIQLFAGAGADHGKDSENRGRLRRIRRAAAGGGPAICRRASRDSVLHRGDADR